MGKLLLGSLFLLTLAACVTTGASREVFQARLATAQTSAQKGQAYYEYRCQRCHDLHMPRSYTASEWRFFVRKYGRKARLTKEQRDLVYSYLAPRARGEETAHGSTVPSR